MSHLGNQHELLRDQLWVRHWSASQEHTYKNVIHVLCIIRGWLQIADNVLYSLLTKYTIYTGSILRCRLIVSNCWVTAILMLHILLFTPLILKPLYTMYMFNFQNLCWTYQNIYKWTVLLINRKIYNILMGSPEKSVNSLPENAYSHTCNSSFCSIIMSLIHVYILSNLLYP